MTHQGQIIGLVLANTYALAQRAAAAVKIEYESLEAIITIKVRKKYRGKWYKSLKTNREMKDTL